jgi:predicted nucleic acid-binding protein
MHIAVVVDASVWVSWLQPQDVNHHASHFWMGRYNITQGKLVAPTILLVEVAAAVSRRTGQAALARQAVNSLTSISEMPLLPLDFTLVQTAVDIATDLQLRAGDAAYVAAAYQLGIPLISWDREHLQRASRIITTYSPITYPF